MLLWLRLIKESIVFAWQAIVTNKLRTFLSLLGVMVGIFVITAVFTLVDTMEGNLKDTFSMLSDDVLFVQRMPWGPEEGDEEYEWWKYMQRPQVKLSDMKALQERLTLADAVSFQIGDNATIEYLNSNIEAQVAAVSYDYKECVSFNLSDGRYFTEMEMDGGRNVAIIGAEVADALFDGKLSVGMRIKVKGQRMDVIGVFKREGSSIISDGFDRVVMVPAEYGTRLIDYNRAESSISIKATEGVDIEELKSEILQTFRPIRKVKPGEDNNFSINQMDIISGLIDSVFANVEIGGWLIGIFAILVGCFSIANIMFVSVRERTKIIGVQKALGAKNVFILAQFLFEAVALCMFGALLAFLLVVTLAGIVNAIDIGIDIGIYPGRFVVALVIALVSGLLAGIIPAVQASRMDPVEAMRA